MPSSTAFLGSPSPIIEEETEAQRREMIYPRGRAGIEPRLVWPRSPCLQLLHTPVPQWAGLGRGPVPRHSQSTVRAPVWEPISGCCAGAPHLSPCPGPPRGPALPGSFRHHSQPWKPMLPALQHLEEGQRLIFVREAGRNQASERSAPPSGYFHALSGPLQSSVPPHTQHRPRGLCPPPQAPLSLLHLPPSPQPGAAPPPTPRPLPGSPVTGAAGGNGCSFSPAFRV